MYDKARKLRLLLVVACLLAFSEAFADRLPLLDADLTDRADVVLVGKVKDVDAKQKEGPATATIEVVETLKGRTGGREIQVDFERSEGRKYPSPMQLQKNEKYSLFLTRSANSYALVNPYDAARKLTPEEKKKTRDLVKRDAKYDELFKHVKISLKVENLDLEQGEKPKLTFSVTNEGKERLAIKGELIDHKGRLLMGGWMKLLYEEVRDGKVHKNLSLGGTHSWRTPDFVVPPGATRNWDALFDWGRYGQSPGTYRLRWKLGKVTSDAVEYTIVEVPK